MSGPGGVHWGQLAGHTHGAAAGAILCLWLMCHKSRQSAVQLTQSPVSAPGCVHLGQLTGCNNGAAAGAIFCEWLMCHKSRQSDVQLTQSPVSAPGCVHLGQLLQVGLLLRASTPYPGSDADRCVVLFNPATQSLEKSGICLLCGVQEPHAPTPILAALILVLN
jgi:hypothetical protein